ncbi:MAG: penicillin-binding protein 2 [Candidatus Saganbacteria bacterium]|nr:penicillin-binding protein 2 [Candidatus Saganbacteria bacterium]
MDKTQRKRILFLMVLFSVVALLIIARLFYLQVIKHSFFLAKSMQQRSAVISISMPRGDIFDANGELLATSVNAYSVFAVPNEIADKAKAAQFLGTLLGMNPQSIFQELNEHKTFAWIKRKAEEWVDKKIKDSGIKGIYTLVEKKRIYPKNSLASSIIGFVGMDNEGLAGIEQSCDDFLRGEEGKILTERDPTGYSIISASKKILQQPQDGKSITLTIDEVIQYYTEQALGEAVKQYNASQGIALVMDPKTGEILAAASKPDFDLNQYEKVPPNRWQSKIASFVYEPGSTFKVITTAIAFDSGAANMDTKLKALDQLEIGGRVIENSHQIAWPGSTITVSKMLEQSINTGAAQLSLKTGPQKFYDGLKKFGFGEYVELYLPGGSRGLVRHPSTWYKPDLAMMAFGQSIAVTPIQLIAAISAIANDGKRVKPYLIKKIESSDHSYVKMFSTEELSNAISPQVAKDVKHLMENVVLYGSGRFAKLADFRVGGKTGTAQKVGEGSRGYLKGHYIASFIGFVPMEKPRLAILLIVDDPKGCIWGERVAAPGFHMIAENSLRYLNVAPDTGEACAIISTSASKR